MLPGCKRQAHGGRYVFQGACSQVSDTAPSPWRLTTAVDTKDYFFGGLPHFSASLAALGLHSMVASEGDRSTAYAAILDCGTDQERYDTTPCEMYRRVEKATKTGGGFALVEKSAYGLTFGLDSFYPPSRAYWGQCYGVDFRDFTAARWSYCTIWMPNETRSRGLYVVVPGEVVTEIPKVMTAAERLLDEDLKACTLKIVDEERYD